MPTAYSSYSAAADPIGEIAHVVPLHPELERNLYRNPPTTRRPLKKDRPEKTPRKPSDPEHKVDDYA